MIPAFTYFFEGVSEVPDNYVDRFERGHTSIAEHARGPNDGHGILVAPFSGCMCVVDKSKQHWEQIDSGVWLGSLKKVDPLKFLRPQHHGGIPVVLADKNEWIIPVANPFIQTCSLPFIYRWKWCEKAKERIKYHSVEEKFQEVSEKAGELGLLVYNQLLKAVTKSGPPEFEFEMSDDEAARFLHKVISINYDITQNEFQSLGVFSPESFQQMFCALIDLPSIEELVKDKFYDAMEQRVLSKKNSTTGDGETDLSETTNPQLLT